MRFVNENRVRHSSRFQQRAQKVFDQDCFRLFRIQVSKLREVRTDNSWVKADR